MSSMFSIPDENSHIVDSRGAGVPEESSPMTDYRLGTLFPGARPGMRNPRPVLDASGRRVGWADSEAGPALVGPLSDADLAAWEADGRYVPEPDRTGDYRLYSIELSDLRATDLRQQAANLVRGDVVPSEEVEELLLDTSTQEPFRQHPALAYRLVIAGHAQAADVLVATEARRVGIAWGADAEWGDLRDRCDLTTVEGGDRYATALEAAVRDWLNDPEAWEARR